MQSRIHHYQAGVFIMPDLEMAAEALRFIDYGDRLHYCFMAMKDNHLAQRLEVALLHSRDNAIYGIACVSGLAVWNRRAVQLQGWSIDEDLCVHSSSRVGAVSSKLQPIRFRVVKLP